MPVYFLEAVFFYILLSTLADGNTPFLLSSKAPPRVLLVSNLKSQRPPPVDWSCPWRHGFH